MYIEYKIRLLSSNPKLKDPDIKLTISATAFLKQIEKAYKAGQAYEANKSRTQTENGYKGLFDDIFKGLKT
jgi:hypothetical protein